MAVIFSRAHVIQKQKLMDVMCILFFSAREISRLKITPQELPIVSQVLKALTQSLLTTLQSLLKIRVYMVSVAHSRLSTKAKTGLCFTEQKTFLASIIINGPL